MRKLFLHFSYSPVAICSGLVAILAITYIGLIAAVMNYAALTVEFSQSARNGEAAVATLEGQYLSIISRISTIDYVAEGYSLPVIKAFVRTDGATALR